MDHSLDALAYTMSGAPSPRLDHYRYHPCSRTIGTWPTRIEIEMRAAIGQAAKDDKRDAKKAKRARLRAAMVTKGRWR